MKRAITFFPCLLLAFFFEASVFGQASPTDVWSLAFDGANQFAEVQHQEALNSFPLTVSLWFKTDQRQIASYLIIKSRTYRPAGGYRLTLLSGYVFAAYAQNPENRIALRDMEWMLADGAWHHLAMVVDTNGGRLFVDGNLRDNQPWSTPGYGPTTSTDPLLFASYPGT